MTAAPRPAVAAAGWPSIAVAVLLVVAAIVPHAVAETLPQVADDGPPSAARLPVQGQLGRGFAPGPTPYAPGHRGVDLLAVAGAAIHAAADGTVVFAGQVGGHRWVSIDHGAGIVTSYGHLRPGHVGVGVAVAAGEVIGQLAGDRDHLHWGARLGGRYVDPLLLLASGRAHLVADP